MGQDVDEVLNYVHQNTYFFSIPWMPYKWEKNRYPSLKTLKSRVLKDEYVGYVRIEFGYIRIEFPIQTHSILQSGLTFFR